MRNLILILILSLGMGTVSALTWDCLDLVEYVPDGPWIVSGQGLVNENLTLNDLLMYDFALVIKAGFLLPGMNVFLPAPGTLHPIAGSPEGEFVLWISNYTHRIYTETGTLVCLFHRPRVRGML